MRFSAVVVALVSAAGLVCAAPIAAAVDSETPFRISRRSADSDFQATIASFESWTPEHQSAWLSEIDPASVHLSPDMLREVSEFPQVKTLLKAQGKDSDQLTNEMFVSWLEGLHNKSRRDGGEDCEDEENLNAQAEGLD
ncbi:hypothetical protein C8F01DRAFT_1288198 [Mycena amicta]|nr:hypothetical protein C8F01DRAFT_1288198 [Mycena amicta]